MGPITGDGPRLLVVGGFDNELTLKMLYYAFIYSRVQYGISVWGTATKTNLHEIEIRLNNICVQFGIKDCITALICSRVQYEISVWGTTTKTKLHDIKIRLDSIARTITWNERFSRHSFELKVRFFEIE